MPPQDDNTRGLDFQGKSDSSKNIPLGNTWFFGIGINTYQYFSQLNNAVKDVEDVADVLWTRYDLDPKHTILLLNEEATRKNIISQLDKLILKIKPEDKLILFYSGHGHLNRNTDKGYWIPTDAEKDNTAHYIRNSTIREYLEDIKSLHTLLISDSCFSGSLFVRGASRADVAIDELEARSSRWAICSGRHDEEVFDGEPGTNSPFTASIIDILGTNRMPKLNVARLADRVVDLTRSNYKQLPEGNPLYGVGHKGGQFVFRLRASESNIWEQCSTENTVSAYSAYLDQFPNGEHADQAMVRLKDLEDDSQWEGAKRTDLVHSYRNYIRRFPKGKHVDEARAAIGKLERPTYERPAKREPLEKEPPTQDSQTTKPQNHKTAKPQNHKTTKPQDRKTEKPQRRKWPLILGGVVVLALAVWGISQLGIGGGGDVTTAVGGNNLFSFRDADTGKFGYEDKKGNIVIEASFDLATEFFDGQAEVRKGEDTYSINNLGECIANCPDHDGDAWQEAQTLDNVDAYNDYLTDFPDGKHKAEAQNKIKEIKNKLKNDEGAKADLDAWEKAKASGNIVAYEEYQRKFPQGQYYEQAEKEIGVIEGRKKDEDAWSRAKSLNDIYAFQEYLNNYSSGLYSDEARRLLRRLQDKAAGEREKIAWQIAERASSLESYEKYLKNYPSGAFVKLAKMNIEKLKEEQAWSKVSKTHTISAYESYLKSYSKGKFVAEAKERIGRLKEELREKQIWDKAASANTVSAYYAYLKNYPKGKYRSEAERKIKSLAPAGHVTVINGGAYVPYFIVNYITLEGNKKRWDSSPLPLGQKKRLNLPAGTTNVTVTGMFNSSKRIFSKTYPRVPNLCFKVDGTVFSQGWKATNCK